MTARSINTSQQLDLIYMKVCLFGSNVTYLTDNKLSLGVFLFHHLELNEIICQSSGARVIKTDKFLQRTRILTRDHENCWTQLLLNVKETFSPFYFLVVFYSSFCFGFPVDPGRAPAVMVVASESLTAGEGQTVVARTSEDWVAASRMTPSHRVEARHQPRRQPVTRRAIHQLEASRQQRRIHATIRVSLAVGASPVMQADHAQSQVHLIEVARLQKTRT